MWTAVIAIELRLSVNVAVEEAKITVASGARIASAFFQADLETSPSPLDNDDFKLTGYKKGRM